MLGTNEMLGEVGRRTLHYLDASKPGHFSLEVKPTMNQRIFPWNC